MICWVCYVLAYTLREVPCGPPWYNKEAARLSVVEDNNHVAWPRWKVECGIRNEMWKKRACLQMMGAFKFIMLKLVTCRYVVCNKTKIICDRDNRWSESLGHSKAYYNLSSTFCLQSLAIGDALNKLCLSVLKRHIDWSSVVGTN